MLKISENHDKCQRFAHNINRFTTMSAFFTSLCVPYPPIARSDLQFNLIISTIKFVTQYIGRLGT